MRGAAAPRTPRLKRNDTLHAYRVAANATDFGGPVSWWVRVGAPISSYKI